MRKQGLFLIGLAIFAALSVAAGFPVPAMLLFTAPVAYFSIRRRYSHVAVLLLCAALVPLIVTGAFALAVVFLLVALCGIVLARLMEARVSLGPGIVIISVLVFAIVAGYTGITWPASHEEWQAALDAYKASLNGGEQADRMLNMLNWLEENWVYISFGMLFGLVVLTVTAINSFLYRKLAVEGVIAPANFRFSSMRVPEHLVWAAIVLAGLWFLDTRLSLSGIRFLAWNGAIALTVVYWINGLSIVVFVIQELQVKFFIVWLLFIGAILFNVHHVLAVVGFFDTWWNFRMKVRKITEARRQND